MRRKIFILLILYSFVSCSKHHGETYSFQGEIGKKIGVTGKLEINNNNVLGSYYYNKYKIPVRIEGSIKGDKINFSGIDSDGILIDYFDGYINKDNSLSGVWASADRKKSMPFFYKATVERSNVNYILFLSVLIFPVVLIAVNKRKNKSFGPFISKEGSEQTAADSSSSNQKKSIINTLNNEDESVRKGKAFQQFVKKRFEKKYYKWLESRSDDRYGDESPESNKYPDLLFSLKHCSETLNNTFAVECKYRSDLDPVGNMYKLFKGRQLANYKEYSQTNNCPTFVVLGVGGKCTAPQDIYIIPLNRFEKLKGEYENWVGVSTSELTSFEKNEYKNFRFFPSSQDLC